MERRTSPSQVGNIERKEAAKTDKRQSQRVFDNIYEQLKYHNDLTTPEKHVEIFLQEISDGAERHVDTIESGGLKNVQIFDEIWQMMDKNLAEYAAAHQGNASRIEKRKNEVVDTYQKLTTHVNTLVARGAVSPLAAKVFLRALPNFKHIGDYNAIVSNTENISADVLKKKGEAFAKVEEEIFAKYPDENKQVADNFGWLHFNTNVGGKVKNRVYISASLDQAPDQVVRAWDEALVETGLQEKVCFKLPYGLMKRFETIIIYLTDKTKDQDVEHLLSAFIKHTPDSLLNDKDMPTGVPIHRGITMAPEPSNINTFLECIGSENTISYNNLMAALVQLAFELSYRDAKKSNLADLNPKILKPGAAVYFDQMVALAGINPDTMVPNVQGGQPPEWAKKIASL